MQSNTFIRHGVSTFRVTGGDLLKREDDSTLPLHGG
jgi:hypothetical protein